MIDTVFIAVVSMTGLLALGGLIEQICIARRASRQRDAAINAHRVWIDNKTKL